MNHNRKRKEEEEVEEEDEKTQFHSFHGRKILCDLSWFIRSHNSYTYDPRTKENTVSYSYQ